MFVPNCDRYPFPDDTGSHYIETKDKYQIIFDKDYPYVDYSKGFAFKRFWVRLLLRVIVFPMAKIRMGIRIKNKSVLKRYKELLSEGAITVSNHVHFWDYICVMKALHNFKWPYLLAWNKNVTGDSGPLVRMVGGIPIPENDNEATVAFNNAIKKLLDDKNFLQVYAEGSMWEYYKPIRPFKRGAFSLAVKYNKPILPMAFSYRKPGWIRRKIFKQLALFDLIIGEPIEPDQDLEKNTRIDDLAIRTHEEICHLAGFDGDNIYAPIYSEETKHKK